jgi:hypothetical protein
MSDFVERPLMRVCVRGAQIVRDSFLNQTDSLQDFTWKQLSVSDNGASYIVTGCVILLTPT